MLTRGGLWNVVGVTPSAHVSVSATLKASSLLAQLSLRLATSDVSDFLQNVAEPPSRCALVLQSQGPNLRGLLEVAFAQR
jgi:hypothetical protein